MKATKRILARIQVLSTAAELIRGQHESDSIWDDDVDGFTLAHYVNETKKLAKKLDKMSVDLMNKLETGDENKQRN